MKKLKQRAGFTLIETMMALMILVLMVVGMQALISSSVRIYSDAIFESDSASLSGILNTTMGDVLRYSEEVTANPADGSYRFTNYSYGVKDGYFFIDDTDNKGTVQLKNDHNSNIKELVTTGSYPHLEISEFQIVPESENCFRIEYKILDKENSRHSRDVKYAVRVLNSRA